MKCCVWPSNINIVYELPWCIACSSGPSSNNWCNLLRLNTENCKFHFSPISFELAVSLQIFVCMVWFFYLLCAVVNILFKIYVFSRPIKKQYLWAGIYLPLVISLIYTRFSLSINVQLKVIYNANIFLTTKDR